jgi:hypothetical protein
MIKPNVSFDEIVKDYTIVQSVQSNGKFFVNVNVKVTGGNVGLIEGHNGAWKVINDPKFETGVLIKAIKRCIDNYLRYMNEFLETDEEF